jgi:hypothetical protein
MLDGTFETLTDTQIITHILAHPFIDPQPPEPEPAPAPIPESASEPEPDPEPAPAPGPAPEPEPGCDSFPAPAPSFGPSDEPVPWPTSPLDPSDFPTDAELSGYEPDARHEQHAAPVRRASSRADASDTHAASRMRAGGGSGVEGGRRWSVGELRVGLSTLVGLDEQPAEIPGWGVIHPGLARQMATEMTSAEWRFVICGEDGRAHYAGLTRARPTFGASASRRDPRRGGIVELQMTQAQLRDLAAHLAQRPDTHRETQWETRRDTCPDSDPRREVCPDTPSDTCWETRRETRGEVARPDGIDRWAAVITDIERQVAHHVERQLDRDPDRQSDCEADREPGQRGESIAGAGHSPTDDSPDDARRRQARAALRRWIQVRGRQCSAPGCRVPAIKTDQDHLTDWILGGPTAEANLALLCRHDHRAKHEGGWRATMPEPGVIVWTSPLGHTYRIQPPLIMPTISTLA